MAINDTYLNIAILITAIVFIGGIFFIRRKRKADEIHMPNMEQDALMDKTTPNAQDANPGVDEVGRWGDGIIGKPRIVTSETTEERVARIHKESQQHQQQRQIEPRIYSIPASVSRTASVKSRALHAQRENTRPTSSTIMVLYVMAKEGQQFVGNDVYQSLVNAGLMYGKMHIFHYHTKRDLHLDILFSVASAVNPGTIEIDNIENFKTPGLTLFMNVSQVKKPKIALETMIAVAEQLADDLDGIVLNDKHEPWSTETETNCFAQFED